VRSIEWLVRGLLTLWLWFLLLGLGLGSLVWNLVAALLNPLLPAMTGLRLGRAAIAYGYRFFWTCARVSGLMRLDAAALDALAREPGGMIIVANHPSMIDALAIVARLPRSFCIMKAALLANPFLGAGARLARYVRNDTPHSMLRSMVSNLRQGGQLVLFPEGTRTEVGRLNRLRPGVCTIAQRAGVPIQTVIIATDSPYLGKGWPIWKLPPIPVVFRLRLGRRFDPEPDHAALLARLEAYFRQELGQGFGSASGNTAPRAVAEPVATVPVEAAADVVARSSR